jgi:cellobiose transport system permease protein
MSSCPGTGQSGLTTVLFSYNQASARTGHAAAVALSIFMRVLLFTAIMGAAEDAIRG